MVTEQYKESYRNYNEWSRIYWQDLSRPEREADIWFNRDRNRISLEMIGHLFKSLKVLAVGASFWIEEEFLKALPTGSILRTDLIKAEGIDQEVDACNMPFPNESFDAIICRELIEHVPDEEILMHELRRVVKVRGYLYITTPNALDIPPDGHIHLRGYTPQGFLQELNLNGFEVIAKRGVVPNIFRGLLDFAHLGMKSVLDEYIEQSRMFDKVEESYHFGSILCILARRRI